MTVYYVYWIHRSEHLDHLMQGYIGVTNNLNKRINAHKRKTNKHLASAFLKYADIVYDVIYEDTKERCYEKERQLRPEGNIGWNISPGGLGGSRKGQSKGRKHTEETKAKISAGNRKPRAYYPRSPRNEETKAKLREAARLQAMNGNRKPRGPDRKQRLRRTKAQMLIERSDHREVLD